MRRAGVCLFNDANNFFQLFHQMRFVIESPRRIRKQHIYVARARSRKRVEQN